MRPPVVERAGGQRGAGAGRLGDTAEPGTEDADRLALAIVLGTQTLVN
ncbi:hypothetical protein [Dactylosporangium matsuzakiense]|nr:hypothetical protein [Dactylosporangium matsuzakiense]UWZ48245.1 hypothetical protein Dmats_18660 [Dactylosporangium matsuzakiense]